VSDKTWDRATLGASAIGVSRPMKTLLVETLDQWRHWLRAHHASESEVWLVFYKQHAEATSIDYEDALDEALCFGWVDSLVKRLDDQRFARKFTPRKPNSRWSAKNRKKYGALKASGRLQQPGIERPPTDRGDASRPTRLSLPSKLPAYIQAGLRKHPAALRHFEALPPEQRRRYFAWIESAKQEETKLRRLKEAIRLLASGKVLGLK
jgi:uncharacterized protein YdeI (YjbR/CyaY-like superfamily)